MKAFSLMVLIKVELVPLESVHLLESVGEVPL